MSRKQGALSSVPSQVRRTPHGRGPGAADVAELTGAAGFPSISVLMPTERAPQLTVGDGERLDELVREVRCRLARHRVPAPERLMARLGDQVERVRRQPADRGLAIFVNHTVVRTFRLTTPVLARAVVEQTFATRALLEELHRTPPYVVLVLDATSARLYQVAGGAMRTVGDRDLFRTPADPRDPDAQAAFLGEVDAMLGAYRERHPSPLVLAGSPELLDELERRSRHLHRLAGRVPPEAGGTAPALVGATAGLLERYLRSRRDDAVARLRAAFDDRPGDVARGLDECRRRVHVQRPEMLCVEQGFVSGRVSADGERDNHDLVDDLMELVILRGGQLAIMADGDLAAHGRVALISRSLRPTGH